LFEFANDKVLGKFVGLGHQVNSPFVVDFQIRPHPGLQNLSGFLCYFNDFL
jgi:hypothetical protein